MKQPESGIVSPKAQYGISIIWHCNRVLKRRLQIVPLQHATLIQVQGVLQVHPLDVRVRRSTHAKDIEGCTMQMEGMTDVDLLHFINENHLNNCIQWNVNFVRALTILATVRWPVVPIAVILLRDVLVLGQHRRGRSYVRDLVDEGYQVVCIRGDYRMNQINAG